MKESLKNAGITLIALVITIIILLILAGVTIGMATSGTGLFDKAKQAAEKYQNAQNDEEIELAKYSNKIDEYINGARNDLEAQTPGTATANDILEGKTAWVNGVKITGTYKTKNAQKVGTLTAWNTGYEFKNDGYVIGTIQSSNNGGADIEFFDGEDFLGMRAYTAWDNTTPLQISLYVPAGITVKTRTDSNCGVYNLELYEFK